jgi:hypothetical protein
MTTDRPKAPSWSTDTMDDQGWISHNAKVGEFEINRSDHLGTDLVVHVGEVSIVGRENPVFETVDDAERYATQLLEVCKIARTE